MSGVNKVILVGRLGKDPEVRNLESGVAVANFTMATSESYKDREGNWQESATWHNVVMWKNQAETVEKYVNKGSLIYIEGKITNRQWDDKDGVKHSITEVIGYSLILLTPKGETAAKPVESSNTANDDFPAVTPQAMTPWYEDDLPF